MADEHVIEENIEATFITETDSKPKLPDEVDHEGVIEIPEEEQTDPEQEDNEENTENTQDNISDEKDE